MTARALAFAFGFKTIEGQGHAVFVAVNDIRNNFDFGLRLGDDQRRHANGQEQDR